MINSASMIIVIVVAVAVVAIIVVLRRKGSISAGVNIPGVGGGRIAAKSNAKDAVIRGGEATEDATATAYEGNAIIEDVKARNITSTAGEPSGPKSKPPAH